MKHMLAAAQIIETYVARGRNTFGGDSALRDAIVYQIIIIGEAAARLSLCRPGTSALDGRT
jgi:uncharacterized protein with HEPN domain